LRLTVNLSACQFQQHNLVEMVARILKETGFEPQLLELEITETVAMEDVDFTSRILNELMEMGIQIAIDDFGTGYSSLNYLKRFPIHTLKIDRSFVHDIITDSQDAAIVSAIIALAQTLNLKVIAEGVETEDQMAFLKCRQCFEMQGYLFGKPVPAKDFETLLRNNLY
jgi:EAL domain-containing protein (putative c-di-GMP-specific phosphodiesterase class I)